MVQFKPYSPTNTVLQTEALLPMPYTQGGEAPICCVLVPSTAVKTQVTSQEEILKVVNGHNRSRAMHSQGPKYFT